MTADQWAGALLCAAGFVGAVVWLRDTLRDRRSARRLAELEARAQAELEQAGPCEVCKRHLGTILVAARSAQSLRLLLVCQGCSDEGTARRWFVVVSTKARRAA